MLRFQGMNVGLIEWVNCDAGRHTACKAPIIKSLQNIEYGFVSFNSQEEGGGPAEMLIEYSSC